MLKLFFPVETSLLAERANSHGTISLRVNHVMATYDGYALAPLHRFFDTDHFTTRQSYRAGKREGWNFSANVYKAERFAHSVPTLVFAGTADRIVPVEESQRFFLKALQGKKLMVTFPGKGHCYAGSGQLDRFWRAAAFGHWGSVSAPPWNWRKLLKLMPSCGEVIASELKLPSSTYRSSSPPQP